MKIPSKKPAQPYDPRRDGITQSILSSWLSCRVKARLGLEGWTSLRTGAALQFGELAHGVLEDVYGEVRDGKRKNAPNKEEVYGLIARRIKEWEEGPKGSRAGADEKQQLEQNAALLEAVLPHYFTFWAEDDFRKTTWVALEQEFLVEMFGVPLRGKRDGVFKDKASGLSLFETKTKGQINEDNMRELLAFDFQSDFYNNTYMVETGLLPTGTRYNIIRRPGQKWSTKPDKKTGLRESLVQYRDRVEAEVIKDPAYYFLRYRISKTKADMAEAQKELGLKVAEFLDWHDGKLPTYKNETACVGKFGACHFLRICANKNYDGFYRRERTFEELSSAKGGNKK